jgi:predicted dinucleotide-binding enzyme
MQRLAERIGDRRGDRTVHADDPTARPRSLDDRARMAVGRAWRIRTTPRRLDAMHSNDPILVIGGTGKTGRRVAERLAARGVPVRIGSRTALRAEAEARAEFPGVTVLRCSFFAQNFTEGAFAPGVQAGELALPVGDVRESFIDADDIADAAVGDTARVRTVPMAEFAGGLASVGLEEAEIALLEYLFGEVLDGRNASVTDGVQQVLGRAPRDVVETVR